METRREFLKHLGQGSLVTLCLSTGCVKSLFHPNRKPNVVLIVCDDLNDYVTGMGGHPQSMTPHLARLAQTGVAFKRAYSNNPVCAPSRASFLTGIYPHTSKNLFWDKWYENPILKNSKTIMEHFRDNGYHVAGSGKLMHHTRRMCGPSSSMGTITALLFLTERTRLRTHRCRNHSDPSVMWTVLSDRCRMCLLGRIPPI